MACSNGINNGLQKMGLCDLDVNYNLHQRLYIKDMQSLSQTSITVRYHGNNAHVTMSRVQ